MKCLAQLLRIFASVALVASLSCRNKEANPGEGSLVETAPALFPSETRYAGRLEMPDQPNKPHQPFSLVTRLSSSTGELVLGSPSGSELHQIVVNPALTLFEHLHPSRRSDDAFDTRLELPETGDYVVFTIFKPRRKPAQILRNIIRVPGPAKHGATVSSRSRTSTGRFGDFEVRFSTESRPVAQTWTTIVFTVTRNGMPVRNLRHIGVRGQVVAISRDAEELVLGHTTEGEALGGARAGHHVAAATEEIETTSAHVNDVGPDVTVHIFFPKGGTYKIWGEFAAGDKTFAAPFAIEVAAR